ncbi:hypothetical protein L9G15_09560 [Shewanella sp. A3A]|nr:hypothetical protein [Shewanella ferrihydritica]
MSLAPHITLSLLLLVASSHLTATELTNNTPLKHPQEQALDADGNPIPLPTEYAPALEYHAHEALVTPVKVSPQRNKTRQSAKADKVADDAGCRWLHSRMGELKRRLKSDTRLAEYFHDEINQYQQQWQCLKCAGAGPAAGDHARCGL